MSLSLIVSQSLYLAKTQIIGVAHTWYMSVLRGATFKYMATEILLIHNVQYQY
jgi:hypothetical protein